MTDNPQQTQEEAPEIRKRTPSTEPAPEAQATAEEPQANGEAPASTPATPAPLRRVVDVAAAQASAQAAAQAPAPEPEPEPEGGDDGLDDQFSLLMSQSMGQGAPARPRLEDGQQVTGKVVHVGEDNIFIDIGGKDEGYLSRREVENAEGVVEIGVGDSIEVYIVGRTSSGVELTRGLAQASDARRALQNAFDNRIPVEGKVTGRNKGGFEISVMGERAFCPISQIEMAYTEDADAHVGQTYRFLVTRYEVKGKNLDVVVSRSELEREERKAKQGETFASLEVDQVRTGHVRKLMNFGAFVDLGGVDGLVHISELSWERVDDPNKVLKPGQEVKVKVLEIRNREAGPDKARISLSIKAVSGSPWDNVMDNFREGGAYDGEVVRMEHFGAFIQLAPGIDGLVHVSELSLGRVRHPRDILQIGQSVRIQILSIDPIRQRISLSIKALHGNPWQNAHERYVEGQEVTGTVENIESFGVFVSMEPGITALIPLSELNTERGREPSLDFRLGQEVTARVLSLEQERERLTLTRRDPSEARANKAQGDGGERPRRDDRGPRRSSGRRERDTPSNWRDDASKGNGSGLGTFADLFPAKLRRRKGK